MSSSSSDSDSDTAIRKANNSKLACSSALQSDDELFPGSDDNVDDKENKSESEVSEGEKNNLLTARTWSHKIKLVYLFIIYLTVGVLILG